MLVLAYSNLHVASHMFVLYCLFHLYRKKKSAVIAWPAEYMHVPE